MNTRILSVDPISPADRELAVAAEVIRQGGLVAFPTETVYGLGADALNGPACGRIFDAKGRPHDNPLIVHIAEPADFEKFATCENEALFHLLAERFMPGPLTVILPKKEIIPDEVTVGLRTVAIRCPSHPVAHRLIELAGVPIAAPSANLSGKPSPTTAEHVIHDMNGRVDLILSGGAAQVGLESTVVALHGDTIRLLRPGFVTAEMLRSVWDKVQIDPAVLSSLKEGEKPESPGMKYRHYAPDTPVTMVTGNEEEVLAFFRESLEKGCGVLAFEEDIPLLKNEQNAARIVSFGKRDDLLSQANGLFDALRRFDKMSLPHIFARKTAQSDLGLAVSNRLLRACAFDILDLEKKK